jgi:sugar lactone lactonase YvrE
MRARAPLSLAASAAISAGMLVCLLLASEITEAQTQLPSTGDINTLAGNGTHGYSGDGGAAGSAELNYPWGDAVDSSGNIYIADEENQRIRKITASTGVISTVAGDGQEGFSGDGGAATSAALYYPVGVAVDGSGNIYIADCDNERIRKVTASTGVITTVAGTGTAGYSGDGGAAISAKLDAPEGVTVDANGNIYIADEANQRIRKVTASTGIITTVAGIGTAGYSGDGGAATSAKLNYPQGVAVDANDDIYIADFQNSRIRKVSASTGVITTVAGTGAAGYSGDDGAATSAKLDEPEGVAVDALGNIYIADTFNYRIREVTVSTGIINTVAGDGSEGYSGDGGAATSAKLNQPRGAAVDAGLNIYISDSYNQRIRAVGGPTPISGYINPKYIVLGIYYVVPGATSFSEYCDTTTVGATNSITNTFTSSYQNTLSVNLTAQLTGWLKGSKTSSTSNTNTQSSSSGSSVTVSQSSSLCNKPAGPTDWYEANNHDYDLILVWTNPVVLIDFLEGATGTIEETQWNGYGFNQLDQPAMEVDQIYVGCLNGDLSTANGTSCADNLAPLQRTWDTDETWPSGEGPALTSQDLANILAQDPFGMCTPDANISPLSYPADNCTNLTPQSNRFTITDNEDVDYGQPIPGGGQNTSIYTLSYSIANSESEGYTTTNSTMYGVEQEWTGSAFSTDLSVTAGNSQTYTISTQTNQSLTTTDSSSTEASVTQPPCNVVSGVCDPLYPSAAAPGPTEFDVYEDTQYGTFLYYPANWSY